MQCPECNKQLEFLVLEEKTLTVFEINLRDDHKTVYRRGATVVKNKTKYYCPECSAMLTKSEKKAAKLLQPVK